MSREIEIAPGVAAVAPVEPYLVKSLEWLEQRETIYASVEIGCISIVRPGILNSDLRWRIHAQVQSTGYESSHSVDLLELYVEPEAMRGATGKMVAEWIRAAYRRLVR